LKYIVDRKYINNLNRVQNGVQNITLNGLGERSGWIMAIFQGEGVGAVV